MPGTESRKQNNWIGSRDFEHGELAIRPTTRCEGLRFSSKFEKYIASELVVLEIDDLIAIRMSTLRKNSAAYSVLFLCPPTHERSCLEAS